MHSSSDDSGADSSQGLLQSQHSASTQLLIAFAEGLRSLSKDEAQHGSMVESGALPLLFSLLRPAKRNASSRTLEICAIHAIRGLAQSEAGRQAIQETDIIVKLGSCLGTDERIAIGSVARAAIVQALASLAQKGGSGCRRAIAEAGLIPTLISMLEGPRATSHAAAVTLRYLSHDEAEACLEAGAIDALTKFVSQSESGAAHRDAAHALEVRQDRPHPRAFPLPGLTTSYSHSACSPSFAVNHGRRLQSASRNWRIRRMLSRRRRWTAIKRRGSGLSSCENDRGAANTIQHVKANKVILTMQLTLWWYVGIPD